MMGLGFICMIIALVLAILKAIGVNPGRVDFGWAAVAFFILGHLIH